ncbi:cytochrome P450 family 71 protein [Medicago truncatula]|uniref:Cytochrome P450 family 71 protein n=1 Tax=Medicago truncatula TaxID=3880 RepID=G7JMV5_MEDTR|nr:cytochrome P450 family 71 protein [Medicago truncatula]
MHLQLGEISTIVVSSPDLAKEILKTRDLAFVQRPKLIAPNILAYDSTGIVFAPYGDYWRQMRKICTSELLILVEKLIQSIQGSLSLPLDVTKIAFSLVSTFVSRAESVEMASGFDVVDLFASFKAIHFITRTKARLQSMQKKSDKILESIINEHQTNSIHAGMQDENLVDVLLRVQQSGYLEVPITQENVKAVIWLRHVCAGSDTSAGTIDWAMSELMKNPRVMKKAQSEIRETFKGKKRTYESDLQELSYLNSVIKETMRLHPPATLLIRECREACNIGGYEIPIKTNVLVNAWFIPERFHDSKYFDFNKVNSNNNNFEYIPFGGGRRMCPGILFGLANIELPLAALLYHFNWELPNGMKPEDLDMTEAFGAVVARRNNLYLIPTPYI